MTVTFSSTFIIFLVNLSVSEPPTKDLSSLTESSQSKQIENTGHLILLRSTILCLLSYLLKVIFRLNNKYSNIYFGHGISIPK